MQIDSKMISNNRVHAYNTHLNDDHNLKENLSETAVQERTNKQSQVETFGYLWYLDFRLYFTLQ